MRPEILTLRNIGPFRGTHTVNFSELGSIFLVYGKTGAGKTTLFDALSYAFYSNAPGGRKGLARAMRSQFSDDSEESAIVLEFTLSGIRYRICRSLPFDRIGVRSGKVQNVAEEVTFEILTKEGWQNKSSTNKSETDRKILDLIGLSEDEFSRIVLLPQGEFSQFLKQNSNERKEVLSKLFPVEKYKAVTELARNRAREMMSLLQDTESAVLALGERFNRLSYDGERALALEEAEALRAAQISLRKELSGKAAFLEQARAAEAKNEQRRALSVRLDGMEARIPLIETQKEKLLASRRAESLAVKYRQTAGTKARTAQLAGELALLAQESESKKNVLDALESERAYIASLHAEKDILHLRKERLRIAVEIAQTLETETRVHADTRKKITHLQKEASLLKEEDNTHKVRIAELEAFSLALDASAERNALAREELETERAKKILADEYEREKNAIGAHSGALENTREQLALNTRDSGIADAEQRALEEEAKAAHTGGLAHDLSSVLKDGEPCPVCGSPVHPSPAKKTSVAEFTFTDRLESGKRRKELIVLKGTALEKKISGHEADLKTANDRLKDIIGKYCAACGQGRECITPVHIPSPAEANERVREASASMQNAADALNRAQKAIRESAELRRKREELETRNKRLQEELLDLKTQVAEQKAAIDSKQKRYKEAFPQTADSPETAGSRSASAHDVMPDPTDASDALERCISAIMSIEADTANHDAKLKEARIQSSALGGKKTEIERTLLLLRKQGEEELLVFENECASAGFSGGEEVLGAACGAEEASAMESEITSFGEELAAARTLVHQLASEASLWKGPGSAEVKAEIEALDARVGETDRRLEEKNTVLSALDSLKARSDELEKERAERSKASGKLASLANDLTGKNSLSTAFDAWILGMYLEEITSYANTRLERMSEGRYRIALNESYRRGNRLSGLDLEIQDAYTGKSRPSGTLSGGETFMASISLALGLADSIQSRSGGIQLDAVFIDEGFGSLDESSLERAISILDEIRGTRMVGLISHVAELKNRIPNRIEIVKTGAGSTIKKETYNEH